MREEIQYKGYTIKIYQDEDAPDPRKDCQNLGQMVCWHRRYNLGDQTVRPESCGSLEQLVASLQARVILPLYLMDHSGLTIRTDPGVFQMIDSAGWDWGQVGLIYARDHAIQKEYGCKRITRKIEAEVKKVLEAEVEVYNQFLQGDVYGYVIEDDDNQHLDSCWGFYGLEEVKKEAQQVVDYICKKEEGKNVQESPARAG